MDDAAVPVELWDQAVCRGPPSEAKQKAPSALPGYILGRYCRRLWLDARKCLHEAHGVGWPKQVKGGIPKPSKMQTQSMISCGGLLKTTGLNIHWDLGSFSFVPQHAIAFRLRGASRYFTHAKAPPRSNGSPPSNQTRRQS